MGLAELIVAKQRNGPTGVVKLTWDNSTTRFKNHAESRGSSYGGGYAGGVDYGGGGGGGGGNASYSEPKPAADTPASAPATGGDGFSSFGNRAQTGPAENHRDGGGPTEFDDDDEFDGDEIAPF